MDEIIDMSNLSGSPASPLLDEGTIAKLFGDEESSVFTTSTSESTVELQSSQSTNQNIEKKHTLKEPEENEQTAKNVRYYALK